MQEIVCEDTNNGWRAMNNDWQGLLRSTRILTVTNRNDDSDQ